MEENLDVIIMAGGQALVGLRERTLTFYLPGLEILIKSLSIY